MVAATLAGGSVFFLLLTIQLALAALFGPRNLPFSITIVFPPFEGESYTRAVEMAKQSAEYREVGAGDALRHRARFFSSEALPLRDLFELTGPHPGTEAAQAQMSLRDLNVAVLRDAVWSA